MSGPARSDEIEQMIARCVSEAGFLNGEGAATAPGAIDNARTVLGALEASGYPRPHLYPTLEGGFSAEWDTDRHARWVTITDAGIEAFSYRMDEDEYIARVLAASDIDGLRAVLEHRAPAS